MKQANNGDLTDPEVVQSLLPWNAEPNNPTNPQAAKTKFAACGFLRHAVRFDAYSFFAETDAAEQ